MISRITIRNTVFAYRQMNCFSDYVINAPRYTPEEHRKLQLKRFFGSQRARCKEVLKNVAGVHEEKSDTSALEVDYYKQQLVDFIDNIGVEAASKGNTQGSLFENLDIGDGLTISHVALVSYPNPAIALIEVYDDSMINKIKYTIQNTYREWNVQAEGRNKLKVIMPIVESTQADQFKAILKAKPAEFARLSQKVQTAMRKALSKSNVPNEEAHARKVDLEKICTNLKKDFDKKLLEVLTIHDLKK